MLCLAPLAFGESVVGGFDWPDNMSPPFGVGYDGTNLWIVDLTADITEVDFDGTPTGNSIPDPPTSDPNDLCWDGSSWWITDWNEPPTVWQYSAAGSVISSFPGPDNERMIGVTFDGTDLWLSSFFTAKIYRVDTTGSVLESFDAPPDTSAAGIAYDGQTHGGPFIWMASQGTQDMIYQLKTDGTVVNSFNTPTNLENDCFGLDWDGSTLWLVTQTSKHIYRIDPFGTAPTPTASSTAMPTATPTGGPEEIEIDLMMPSHTFSTGDPLSLHLTIDNPGSEQEVDLYVLLHIGNMFWSYPSWQSLDMGLDHADMTVPNGTNPDLELIPEIILPTVGPGGPFYFYAAMFEDNTLSLDTLASNGAVWNFSFE
jgi:hypothetical protein